jgi:ABC-type antimicrobial peptide transport system permease subunit
MVILRKLQDVVEDQSRSWRLGTTLFVAFGGLAVVVAAVGLYGVIGYTIAQRMHELGMRIALGARSSHILKLVLGQGVWFAGTGAAIGLALAFTAVQAISARSVHLSQRGDADDRSRARRERLAGITCLTS